MSKKFVKEFKRNYRKLDKATSKWVRKNPEKAIALSYGGEALLVGTGAFIACKVYDRKSRNALCVPGEKKEGLISKIKNKFKKNPTPDTPAPEAAAPTTEIQTSSDAPATPAES